MRLHHLAFRTVDVERLEAFYVALLGLRVCARPDATRVWLTAGDAVVMIERAAAGEPGVTPGSLDLVAFTVDESTQAALEVRLAAAFVPIEARTELTLYVRDPDGRRIGLSRYAFPAPLTP